MNHPQATAVAPARRAATTGRRRRAGDRAATAPASRRSRRTAPADRPDRAVEAPRRQWPAQARGEVGGEHGSNNDSLVQARSTRTPRRRAADRAAATRRTAWAPAASRPTRPPTRTRPSNSRVVVCLYAHTRRFSYPTTISTWTIAPPFIPLPPHRRQ